MLATTCQCYYCGTKIAAAIEAADEDTGFNNQQPECTCNRLADNGRPSSSSSSSAARPLSRNGFSEEGDYANLPCSLYKNRPATPRISQPPPHVSNVKLPPLQQQQQYQLQQQQQKQLVQSQRQQQTPSTKPSPLQGTSDDEHNLIARYAARLAVEESDYQEGIDTVGDQLPRHRVQPPGSSELAEHGSTTKSSDSESSMLSTMVNRMAANATFGDGILEDSEALERRRLLEQLEARNREMAREIRRLRHERDAAIVAATAANSSAARSAIQGENEDPYNLAPDGGPVVPGSAMSAELEALRQHKDGLESRMTSLQESRRDLMRQLEMLMSALKTGNTNVSLPNAASRQLSMYDCYMNQPNLALTPTMATTPESGQAPNVWALRNDLLSAADSVTSAMSNLVKHFSSDTSETSEDDEYLQQWCNRRGLATSSYGASTRSRAHPAQPSGSSTLPNPLPPGGTAAYFGTGPSSSSTYAVNPGGSGTYYRPAAPAPGGVVAYSTATANSQLPYANQSQAQQQAQPQLNNRNTPLFYDPAAVTIHDI